MNNPTLIAIDGGPCSGKTTGMVRVSDTLVKIGRTPLIIPETATLLINSGIAPWNFQYSADFQRHVLSFQMANEDRWIKAGQEIAQRARAKSPVFLCDRGLLSSAAYLPKEGAMEKLNELLTSMGSSVEEARARYAGVVHMVTAAEGAPEFYTLANNSARKESAEEAKILDKRTMEAWLGHSHLAVVGNVDKNGKQISFEEKMKRVVTEVLHILGFPVPIEIEDRYKLDRFSPLGIPVSYEVVSIEQHYLYPYDSRVIERVRKRTAFGGNSYFHTTKEPALNGGRVERERPITAREYKKLLERLHPDCHPIFKDRYCFIWRNQYFEADMFAGLNKGLIILEREKTELNATTQLPPFLHVEKEVTNDAMYSNWKLAQK